MPVDKKKEVEFDENGAPVGEEGEETEQTEEVEGEEGAEAEEAGEAEGEETEAPAAEAGKYRIGEKTFATQAEALAYAQEIESSGSEVDAYRQIVREALSQPAAPESVTPPEAAFDEQKYYENPGEFLKQYAQDIKNQTLAEVRNADATRSQSDAIWNEFTGRHPDLADFRTEAENFTGANLKEVQRITQTKGRPAALDFIALKMRAQFERYASATKPARKLSNGTSGTTPSSRGSSVTPKPKAEKILSMKDQIRLIKKVR